jgi:very-short-patch-repair endonuclease
MSQLKINTTAKLFYKRLLYKVVITCNGINHLHRRGMNYVKEVTPMGSGFWGSRHWSQNVFDNKKELLDSIRAAYNNQKLNDRQQELLSKFSKSL